MYLQYARRHAKCFAEITIESPQCYQTDTLIPLILHVWKLRLRKVPELTSV